MVMGVSNFKSSAVTSAAGVGAAAAGGPVGFGMLLAFQAAGAVLDYSQTRSQQKLIQVGRDLEQAAFESNLEAIQLESSEESLQEMKQLRQNLGTQIATQAARGTNAGAGSAFMLTQTSIGQFNSDERTRRLNLLAKQANLRGQNVISGLHTLQSETQLGQAMTNRFINSIGTTAVVDSFRRSPVAKKWGFGLEPVS